MNFPELVCEVAGLRFADEAQVGVRVSPVVISPEEALDLVRAARRLLPPGTFVAVACPGAQPFEDERTCVSDGERAAERATYWRNHLRAEEGERILYVSARRLGRAGGLQDTLFELTEARLRAGALQWCKSEGSGCPPELAEALQDSGVAELADARALADFLDVTLSAEDPMRAAGDELPRLSLARDSALTDAPAVRLKENARWVRKASAGSDRGVGKLSSVAAATHRALIEATALEDRDDRASALRGVDLGALSVEDLAGPQPKPRQSRPAPPPKPVAAKPTVKPRPDRPTHQRAQALVAAPAPVHLDPPPPPPPAPVHVEPPPSPVREPEGDLPPPPPATASQAGAPGGPRVEAAGEAEEPGAPWLDPAPGDDAGVGEDVASAPRSPSDPGEERQRPPRGRQRAVSGPWTEAMHAAALGAPAPLPRGLFELLSASLDRELAALEWWIAGEDPARVLAKAPRGLGEPAPPPLVPPPLASSHAAWSVARAALVEAIGGAAALDRLIAYPYSTLGAPEVAPLAAGVLAVAVALLEAAAASGADDLRWALQQDTVSVLSVTGPAAMALSPLHPLPLSQALDRLPGAEEAARARDLRRALLARTLARPLRCPSTWPGTAGLIASPPAPGVLGYATRPGSLPAEELEALTAAVTRRYLAITPHARSGLRVQVDAEDVDAIASGVAAGSADAPPAHTWLHAPRPVGSPPVEAEVAAGRWTLCPTPTERERPHLLIRARAGALALASGDAGIATRFVEWSRHAGAAPGGVVDAGGGTLALASLEEVALDGAAWEVVLAPSLQGVARRGGYVLLRSAAARGSVAVLSRDVRSVAREVQPSLQQLGVADVRPKAVQGLVEALATGSGGVISLDAPPQRQLAALLLEHALFEALGEDAVVAPITAADASLWLDAPLDPWGAFAVGAARRQGRLAVRVGYGAVAGAMRPEDLDARLTRAWAVIDACAHASLGSAAREALGDLLARGAGRLDDARVGAEPGGGVDVSYGCVLPAEHPWAGGARVGGTVVEAQVADTALLERVIIAARRRR